MQQQDHGPGHSTGIAPARHPDRCSAWLVAVTRGHLHYFWAGSMILLDLYQHDMRQQQEGCLTCAYRRKNGPRLATISGLVLQVA